MKRVCRPGVLAVAGLLVAAGLGQAQKNLDELEAADLQAAIKKTIAAERKKPLSPPYRAADTVFVLTDVAVAKITYDAGTHTLTWRCPVKAGVARARAREAARQLRELVKSSLITAGVIVAKQVDNEEFKIVIEPAVVQLPDVGEDERPVTPPVQPPAAQGPRGPAGPQGPPGERGPAGPQGPPGERGPAGPQGPPGERGPQGPGMGGQSGSGGSAGRQGQGGSGGQRGGGGRQGGGGAGTTTYTLYYYPAYYPWGGCGWGCGWGGWGGYYYPAVYTYPVAYTSVASPIVIVQAPSAPSVATQAVASAPAPRRAVPQARLAAAGASRVSLYRTAAPGRPMKQARSDTRLAEATFWRPATGANPEGLFWDGYTLYWQGRYRDALDSIEAALAESRSDARFWYYKALCERVLGQHLVAEASVRQARKLRAQGLPQVGLIGSALERVQGADRRFLNGEVDALARH